MMAAFSRCSGSNGPVRRLLGRLPWLASELLIEKRVWPGMEGGGEAVLVGLAAVAADARLLLVALVVVVDVESCVSFRKGGEGERLGGTASRPDMCSVTCCASKTLLPEPKPGLMGFLDSICRGCWCERVYPDRELFVGGASIKLGAGCMLPPTWRVPLSPPLFIAPSLVLPGPMQVRSPLVDLVDTVAICTPDQRIVFTA